MVLNLNQKIIQLYEAKGDAQPGSFDYQRISKTEFTALNTYDWSPTIRGLVALGTKGGNVNLLRVDDDSNASIDLPLKIGRPCQSVAFNTLGHLAVGLERVRNDSCLQIWDVNDRLSDWDVKKPGWTGAKDVSPMMKLEASVAVTSVRFFEDNPQTLVVGIKTSCVRIHDLRGCCFVHSCSSS